MDKLIYPALSYKITGILFKVHNQLGRFCSERQYCDLIEKYLSVLNFKLAILVNFRTAYLHPKRILNSSVKELPPFA